MEDVELARVDPEEESSSRPWKSVLVENEGRRTYSSRRRGLVLLGSSIVAVGVFCRCHTPEDPIRIPLELKHKLG